MSDEQGFLARWSRRKRAAEAEAGDETQAAETSDTETTELPATGHRSEEGAAETALDPASLPPIESIGPTSDVRDYLKTGVPPELTRAALRRAWSADPAIRDFVGLQENSWDFNAPGGESGFGLVTSEEAQRLFALMMQPPEAGDPAQAGDAAAPAASADAMAAGTEHAAEPGRDQASDEGAAAVVEEDPPLPQRDKDDDALQHPSRVREERRVSVRRGHGGALPQ